MLIFVWIRGFFGLYSNYHVARVLSETTVELVHRRHLSDKSAGSEGYLEYLRFGKGRVMFRGWLHSDQKIKSIDLVIGDRVLKHKFATDYPVDRQDVLQAHPEFGSEDTGFSYSDRGRIPQSGAIEIWLSLANGKTAKLSAGTYSVFRTGAIQRGYLTGLARFFVRHVMHEIPKLLPSRTREATINRVVNRLDTGTFTPLTEVVDLNSLVETGRRKPAQLKEPVDVVIPVFNGMKFLPRLFNRLARSLPKGCGLIVINDASTDPAVLPFLRKTGKRRAFRRRWTLINHEANQGFIASANDGITASLRHVALLNTDAVPPDAWLERLMAPIFADETVASTTPFSTSAEICSFPRICEDNPLPPGLSVDDVDRVFARLNASHRNIELPTGVGFCMGLNRTFLDRIGGFDEVTFGRGYGEENDWCQRAIKAGGRNVLNHNLFVEHVHGGSFDSEEKKQLLAKNLKALGHKHPHYHGDVAEFLHIDPISAVRGCALAMLTPQLSSRPLEVIIDHSAGGGANRYRQEVIEEYKRQNRPVILITNESGNLFHAEVYVAGSIGRFSFPDFSGLNRLLPQHGRIRWHYNCAVGFTNIEEVVDFMVHRKEHHGDRIIMALHDFFPVCRSYNLLNSDGKYCDLPELSVCRTCLRSNPFAEPVGNEVSAKKWREMWGRLLARIDRVRAYSNNSADILRRAYPYLDLPIVVRPHSTTSNHAQQIGLQPLGKDQPVNIVVVGAIGYSKGADMVRRAARIIANDKLPARLKVIGTLDSRPTRARLEVTGAYEHADLPDLLRKSQAHVAWVPSIWPETFSYVTSELTDLELPVACFDVGAPAERLRSYERGLVISEMVAKKAVKEIIDFAHRVRQAG